MSEEKEDDLYQRVTKQKSITVELEGYSLEVYNQVRVYVKDQLTEWLEGKDKVDPEDLIKAIVEFGDDYFESLLNEEDSITSPKSIGIRISAAFFANILEKIIERILEGQDSIEKS